MTDQPRFAYKPSPDQRARRPARHKVVVVGAGPVGLTAAIDLASRGVKVVLLDDDDTISEGSRAICWAKRTLEIFDRLGVAAPMMARGITWQFGKVFRGDRLVYSFDLQPEGDHAYPAFINLQQYHVERILIERAGTLPGIDLRWKNRVVSIAQEDDFATLTVETPDGFYTIDADYVIAADGAKSVVRKLMGLEFRGRVFEDRFLIADVRMKTTLPTERRFWFDPPFHRGQSALLHRQPDDIWRIDLQLGWNVDAEREKRPDAVVPRIKAMLGPDQAFELVWASVYTFQCRRLERFRHGRIFFAGDSAHQVAPFGARGGNSGIQDVDDLGWKLALVLQQQAGDELLDSYDKDRTFAADENIRIASRTTDFITPKGVQARAFRDAVLSLAERHDFARALVNSGRLSRPSVLAASPLNTPDGEVFAGDMQPGAPAADAPVRAAGATGWLLQHLRGGFTGLYFAPEHGLDPATIAAFENLARGRIPVTVFVIGGGEGARILLDAKKRVAERYDGRAGTFYLFRPDQHVAARWRRFDPAAVTAALARAIGEAVSDIAAPARLAAGD